MNRYRFEPDERLIADAKSVIADCVAESESKTVSVHELAEEVLEALGTLVFLGREQDALDRKSQADLSWIFAEIGPSLAEALSEQLDDALAEISMLASELRELKEESRLETETLLVDALAARDRVELVLEGARVALGREPGLTLDLQVSLESFEQIVSPILWQTLPLGPRRAAKAYWCTPEMRPRLWWWHRGADLPYNALEQLETAALVIQAFPEAREELEQMIQSAEILHKAARFSSDLLPESQVAAVETAASGVPENVANVEEQIRSILSGMGDNLVFLLNESLEDLSCIGKCRMHDLVEAESADVSTSDEENGDFEINLLEHYGFDGLLRFVYDRNNKSYTVKDDFDEPGLAYFFKLYVYYKNVSRPLCYDAGTLPDTDWIVPVRFPESSEQIEKFVLVFDSRKK